MSFVCPRCTLPKLNIIRSIELAPDINSAEITLQLIQCTVCALRAVAAHTVSQKEYPSEARYHHQAWKLPEGEFHLIRSQLEGCPSRRNGFCTCTTHQMLGHRSADGQWNGLTIIRRGEAFDLQPVRTTHPATP